jgi:uncharacterized protein (TIGR00369 family)
VTVAQPQPPADPFERLKHEMERPPYHNQFLRPQPVSADAATGTIVIALPYRLEFRHAPDADGYHGGVLAALVDIAAHAAIAVQIGRPAPTIDLRIDYLRPAPGVDLTATAKILRLGGSIARADVEITGGDSVPLVVGRGTFSTRA